MRFEHAPTGIKVTFDDGSEVETVRLAYKEGVVRKLSVGNDSSISQHEEEVIDRWTGASKAMYRGSQRLLTGRLRDFHEATEERVDELLTEHDNPNRTGEAARRYELGARAFELLERIDFRASMDEDLRSL